MRRLLVIACVLFACLPLAAQQRVIRLASLEWPPYSGTALPEQGASVAVIRAACEAMGYRLEVVFVPWLRGVDMARHGQDGVVGYFPEYTSEEVRAEWWLSAPIGRSPLGFAELSRRPVRWRSLDDLRPFTIGVVRGYVNTDDLDRMIRFGDLRAEYSVDDLGNLRKVAGGRLRLAVVDRNVLQYFRAQPEVAGSLSGVQFNERLLEDKPLYVAIRRGAAGESALRVINQGLTRISAMQISDRLMGVGTDTVPEARTR